MKIIAKVRYVDFQKRSHTVEIESDTADRKHLEDLVKARYPADKVFFSISKAEIKFLTIIKSNDVSFNHVKSSHSNIF